MTTPDITHSSLQRLSDVDSLRRLARAIVGEDHADDVVQDAFEAALSHRGAAPDSWPRWMTRVTQRLAWKRRVQTRNRRDRERAVQRDEVVGAPDDLIAEIEEKQLLERALLELDEPYRSALLMRYYGDLPLGEVARRAGRPASTTRTHVERGLKELRAKLEAQRGANWSAALLPFLLPREAGPKSALGLTSKGLSLLTAMKIASLTLLGLLLAGYGISRFTEAGALSTSIVTGVSAPPALAEAAEPESVGALAPEVLHGRAVAVAQPPVPPVGAEPSSAAAPTADGPVTLVRLLEGTSGQPLAGIGATVHYFGMKRSFFSSHTERRTLAVETDSQGQVELPFEITRQGKAAQNRVTFELDLGPGFLMDCTCSFQGIAKDGVLEFALGGAHCAWVVLPEALSADERGSLSATVTLHLADEREEVQYGSIRPVIAAGQKLLFVIPTYAANRHSLVNTNGVLHIATTPVGRAFHAALPQGVSLSTPPIAAIRAGDVIHRFKVTDAGSGAPLPEVNVSVSKPDPERYGTNPYVNTVSRGRSDANGTATLSGIPGDEIRVYVDHEGYEPFRELDTLSAGGETELRLRKKADLRTVKVVITGTRGAPPQLIQLDVLERESGTGVVHLMCRDFDRRGEGWRLEETLQNVPGGLAFLQLHVMSGSYDAPRFVRLEPGDTEVEIGLGEELELRPVILRLPAGIRANVTYRFTGGRTFGTHGPLAGDETVVQLPADGRPWSWMLDVDGFVPAIGTEADLRPSEFRGKPCLDLVPELREGWGTIVHAQERSAPADLPFALFDPAMIPGVTILDPETGSVLGITNDRGHVVIESPEPLMELTARHGKSERTFEFKGGRSVGFGF